MKVFDIKMLDRFDVNLVIVHSYKILSYINWEKWGFLCCFGSLGVKKYAAFENTRHSKYWSWSFRHCTNYKKICLFTSWAFFVLLDHSLLQKMQRLKVQGTRKCWSCSFRHWTNCKKNCRFIYWDFFVVLECWL